MRNYKRITLLCGHYGSGKTNVAIKMAHEIKESYDNTVIADLDIVNPYFRTKDSIEELNSAGIRLIVSEYAGTNVDIPALPQEMYSIIHDKSIKAVIDVGGDDRGALALGRLTPKILEENDYDMLLVVNCYRPLTPDVNSTIEVAKEIETACKIKFTGVINNSNLGELTTGEDVLTSLSYAEEIAKALNVKVKYTTVKQSLYGELKDKIKNLYPMTLQKKI